MLFTQKSIPQHHCHTALSTYPWMHTELICMNMLLHGNQALTSSSFLVGLSSTNLTLVCPGSKAQRVKRLRDIVFRRGEIKNSELPSLATLRALQEVKLCVPLRHLGSLLLYAAMTSPSVDRLLFVFTKMISLLNHLFEVSMWSWVVFMQILSRLQ